MTPSSTPPFTRLASVYDAIMDDVEYDAWVAFVLRHVTARGFRGGRLLDLGCGTGNATRPAADRGFTVDGVDASEAMLRAARRKVPDANFVRSDLRDFALPRRYGLAFAVFDVVNNLLDPADVRRAFARVYAHLEPGGWFAFDANTRAGLSDLWEGGRAEGWAGQVYYRWIHTFDEASGLARVEAHCRLGAEAFTEVHLERPLDPAELRAYLRHAGFEAVEVIAYPEGEAAAEDEPRVWALARRPG